MKSVHWLKIRLKSKMDMVFFMILKFGAKCVASKITSALTFEAISAAVTSDEICVFAEDSRF